MDETDEGAFAFLDCLGFKGIWKNKDKDPALVIEKLRKIENITKQEVDSGNFAHFFGGGSLQLHVAHLSDSVAISVKHCERKLLDPREQDFLVASLVAAILKTNLAYAMDDPPLALRGCVTYGQHLSEGNFFVGPAVDDAADHYAVPDGAFIWLRPCASLRYQRFLHLIEPAAEPSTIFSALVMESYNMPLHHGDTLQCSVLNPFIFGSESFCEKVIDSYKEAMRGDRMDVLLKRQKTLAFLDVAKCRWLSALSELERIETELKD